MSYSIDSDSEDVTLRDRAYNSFVIFDPIKLLGCRDFEFLQLVPDNYVGPPDYYKGCNTFFEEQNDVNVDVSVVSRTNRWNHIAVTWDAAKNGTVSIYKDGLRMITAPTARTEPLEQGGTFILGAEQDCFGGCTEASQSFYGFMDDVRLWNVARSADDILRDFRGFVENEEEQLSQDNLIAYWRFDDPDGRTQWTTHDIARDFSKHGNDLTLLSRPYHFKEILEYSTTIFRDADDDIKLNALRFDNNYASNSAVQHFPKRSFTVEFWAKLEAHTDAQAQDEVVFFSYADILKGDGNVDNDEGLPDTVMLDDAIYISRYLFNYQGMAVVSSPDSGTESEQDGYDIISVNTTGACSVNINTNREGTNGFFEVSYNQYEWGSVEHFVLGHRTHTRCINFLHFFEFRIYYGICLNDTQTCACIFMHLFNLLCSRTGWTSTASGLTVTGII